MKNRTIPCLLLLRLTLHLLSFISGHFQKLLVYDDSKHFPSCAKDGKNVAFGKALSTDVLKLIEAITIHARAVIDTSTRVWKVV